MIWYLIAVLFGAICLIAAIIIWINVLEENNLAIIMSQENNTETAVREDQEDENIDGNFRHLI